jgi:hypothetical protein
MMTRRNNYLLQVIAQVNAYYRTLRYILRRQIYHLEKTQKS